MVELLPARFQGHPRIGCYFFFGPFFFFFFLFLLHLARGCAKKTYFYRFFLHTLLKHLAPSCSNKEVKPKLPQKKVHHFFRKPLFWPNFFSKTLILHHPLKTVHKKISKKKPYFYRLKKRWPSYWPYHGQVIDPKMAKKWPSYWPYCIYTIRLLRLHTAALFWANLIL